MFLSCIHPLSSNSPLAYILAVTLISQPIRANGICVTDVSGHLFKRLFKAPGCLRKHITRCVLPNVKPVIKGCLITVLGMYGDLFVSGLLLMLCLFTSSETKVLNSSVKHTAGIATSATQWSAGHAQYNYLCQCYLHTTDLYKVQELTQNYHLSVDVTQLEIIYFQYLYPSIVYMAYGIFMFFCRLCVSVWHCRHYIRDFQSFICVCVWMKPFICIN